MLKPVTDQYRSLLTGYRQYVAYYQAYCPYTVAATNALYHLDPNTEPAGPVFSLVPPSLGRRLQEIAAILVQLIDLYRTGIVTVGGSPSEIIASVQATSVKITALSNTIVWPEYVVTPDLPIIAPSPAATLPGDFATLLGIYTSDPYVIREMLTIDGSYTAIYIDSALRQMAVSSPPLASNVSTADLVKNALLAMAPYSWILHHGGYTNAVYGKRCVPASLFGSFTTTHFVNNAFTPRTSAQELINAIIAAREGLASQILALSPPSSSPPLSYVNDLLVGKYPTINFYIYASFDATLGLADCTYDDLNNATDITQTMLLRSVDRAFVPPTLELNTGTSTLSQFMAPINDAITIILTAAEFQMETTIHALKNIEIPTITYTVPSSGVSQPDIPNLKGSMETLIVGMNRDITSTAHEIIRDANDVLTSFKRYLNSGLSQEVAAELVRGLQAGLTIYFGLINDAVELWSKTVVELVQKTLISIQPKIVQPRPIVAPAPRFSALVVKPAPVYRSHTHLAYTAPPLLTDITGTIGLIILGICLSIYITIASKFA